MSQIKNPWKKLADQKIYENPWIRLVEYQVIHPGGEEGIYGKIFFKNKAIGIIPMDEEQHTWLVGQFRFTLDAYSWEIPMGGGPLDTNILTSARRELKEETGISAGRWTEILRIHTSNSVTDEEGFVFLAEDLDFGEPEFDPTEKLEIRRLPFREALDMVMDGRITDSLSIAGLLKTARIIGL